MSDSYPPSVEVAATYAGLSEDDSDLLTAYSAELAAQRKHCRAPRDGEDTGDLEAALLRRVACHLARKAIPLAVQVGEFGTAYTPGRDPEVRRLEAPYRRLVLR